MNRKVSALVSKYKVGTLFFLPFFTLFVIFVVLPIFTAIGTSFTDYDLLNPGKFVGLSNYRLLLFDDDIFVTALKNTLVFALFSGPIGYLASFFMAWIINQLRFKSVFALAFYAPSITSSVAMSVVWLYIFSSDRYGFANNLLYNMGFINQPILWNQDATTIMPIIILISIWMSMGTGFLVFLAGLQNVSPDICEAGQIDGIRNRFQELVYITLPQMKPQLLFGAINAISGAFGVFDIAVAFAGMPSPGYAAHTLVAHLYDYAFVRFEMGYASAVACVLFLLTFFFGRICMKVFASND
ncbi:MAG: sugar ABC transporter permease [Clostridia bacterium]|nr:sugar ABC transporter permease [Clostridia bacterium]